MMTNKKNLNYKNQHHYFRSRDHHPFQINQFLKQLELKKYCMKIHSTLQKLMKFQRLWIEIHLPILGIFKSNENQETLALLQMFNHLDDKQTIENTQQF